MKISGIFKLKKVVLCALAVVLAALTAVLFLSSFKTHKNGGTKKDRVEFLKDLGVTVAESEETEKTVTVPAEFGAVYKNYNLLQKRAGYDLTRYKGVKITLYSYTVSKTDNTVYFANLLVYKGDIIGGDVSSAALDGEMVPLKKEEIKKCLK